MVTCAFTCKLVLKRWSKSEFVEEEGEVMCTITQWKEKPYLKTLGWVFRKKKNQQRKGVWGWNGNCWERLVVGEEGEGLWSGRVPPVLSGLVDPPSGSGFGVNMGSVDPFPPQGTQTPGLPTFHFYFPGCKMPLAISAGGVLFFFNIYS